MLEIEFPVRMAKDEEYYVDYSVVDMKGRVIRLPPEYFDFKDRERQEVISRFIVDAMNEKYRGEKYKEGAEDNFCAQEVPVEVVVKRKGNPNWIKGMKSPNSKT